MSEEIARKICEQTTNDIEDLCNCCRKNEKDKSCIGCRELAIKTILQENQHLTSVLKEIREFCDYLLNNDKVLINGKVYYKTSADDIVIEKFKEIIDKGIGEDK